MPFYELQVLPKPGHFVVAAGVELVHGLLKEIVIPPSILKVHGVPDGMIIRPDEPLLMVEVSDDDDEGDVEEFLSQLFLARNRPTQLSTWAFQLVQKHSPDSSALIAASHWRKYEHEYVFQGGISRTNLKEPVNEMQTYVEEPSTIPALPPHEVILNWKKVDKPQYYYRVYTLDETTGLPASTCDEVSNVKREFEEDDGYRLLTEEIWCKTRGLAFEQSPEPASAYLCANYVLFTDPKVLKEDYFLNLK